MLTQKIDNILKEKNLSRYKLSKLVGCSESALNQMARGETKFSDNIIEKILPILEVSREEFESWILADKYPKKIIERAIQIKKEFPYKRKSVLTTKIDEILEEKGMSRTALAKQINYSQSGLNRMITGKINMSRPVLEKISKVLDIPQEEILSWILADKNSLKSLEVAYIK
ncbi:MAG: hypothetical protein ACD_20C00243G0002 [uncultured bacterium]|nr:MAG: hypothetical protein ACD_20C00243G0002 [uncultured bacterium]